MGYISYETGIAGPAQSGAIRSLFQKEVGGHLPHTWSSSEITGLGPIPDLVT